MSRITTRPFYATRLIDESSCRELEGCDISGDILFDVDNSDVLNDTFHPQGQYVNGVPVVHFTCGPSSYCVKKSTFYDSTDPAPSPDQRS